MKIGTIGSGFIVRTILSKVAVTEGMECKAVYSRKYETGKAIADDFGVEKVYTDLDSMLADPEPFVCDCRDAAACTEVDPYKHRDHDQKCQGRLPYQQKAVCDEANDGGIQQPGHGKFPFHVSHLVR